MAKVNSLIDMQKLSDVNNPKLRELTEDVSDPARIERATPSAKPAWGRRFNASGKMRPVV